MGFLDVLKGLLGGGIESYLLNRRVVGALVLARRLRGSMVPLVFTVFERLARPYLAAEAVVDGVVDRISVVKVAGRHLFPSLINLLQVVDSSKNNESFLYFRGKLYSHVADNFVEGALDLGDCVRIWLCVDEVGFLVFLDVFDGCVNYAWLDD